MNADFPRSGGLATADAAETATLDDRPLRTAPIRPTGDAGDGWGRAAAYDAYADGLHTYAIWSLRDHDAAIDALYCTFVIADHHVTQLRQPEHIQPWLYAIMRRECTMRASADSPWAMATSPRTLAGSASVAHSDTAPATPSIAVPMTAPATASVNVGGSPTPVSGRLRPPGGSADPSGSLASLERNLRRAEFHSLEWPESEGLAPGHREILELTIRHGLDSHGLGLVLGLGQGGRSGRIGGGDGILGSVGSRGFGVLADAWRELERSLAAVAVAKASREHCAQLAELTFGWTGRLTATLRAPLTDHVDGCTRCQHYLHTVIGTPAAPTILPFVAAPRSLRDMLLGELHDPQVALRLGIDHDAIAARIQRFTSDGFPAIAEPAPVRRRGGRRAAPKGSVGAVRRTDDVTRGVATDAEPTLPRRTPGASGRRADDAATPPTVAAPATGTDTSTAESAPTSMPAGTTRPDGAPRAQAKPSEDIDATGVYRVPGSWAARVLPADSDATMSWRPEIDGPLRPVRPRERRTGSADSFISTPSGRFAVRAPNTADNAGTAARPSVHAANVGATASVGTSANAAATARVPRFVAPSPEAPRGVDGKPRPRHKSRPMRQAVLSAVALGAVGAAAAASAALLGAASENHSPLLADPGASQDPVNAPNGGDGLSVSVSTPPAPGESPGAHSPNLLGSGGNGLAQAPGATGVGGAVGGTIAPSSAPPAGHGVNPADFRVSVNQRAADPNSVAILLRNIGSTPITWSATAHDRWIVLSQSSGTLAAGQSLAIVATATSAAPTGSWTSTVTFSPSGAVVTLRGYHSTSGPTPTAPSTPPTGTATPSSPAGSSAPPPSGSTPTPTPTPSAESSSASGVGPSTAGPAPSRSVAAGGGTPSAPSGSVSAHPTPTESASTAQHRPRPRPH